MSLTANELRLMMERGHQGYLFAHLPTIGNVCGKVPADALEITHDIAPSVSLIVTDGRRLRVPKMSLYSATAAQLEAAFQEDVLARQRAKEAKIARPTAPLTPFRPSGRPASKPPAQQTLARRSN